jgi:hypothetical protein
MAAEKSVPAFQLGDIVRLHDVNKRRGKIVELRGPLAPGGMQLYRVLLRRKPRPAYIEVREDQIDLIKRKEEPKEEQKKE